MTSASRSLVCLTTSAAPGGAETSLLTLLQALRRLEPAWNITVIAPSAGPLLERCASAGITALVLPFPDAIARLGESGATGRRRRSSNQVSLAADGLRAGRAAVAHLTAAARDAPNGTSAR